MPELARRCGPYCEHILEMTPRRDARKLRAALTQQWDAATLPLTGEAERALLAVCASTPSLTMGAFQRRAAAVVRGSVLSLTAPVACSWQPVD